MDAEEGLLNGLPALPSLELACLPEDGQSYDAPLAKGKKSYVGDDHAGKAKKKKKSDGRSSPRKRASQKGPEKNREVDDDDEIDDEQNLAEKKEKKSARAVAKRPASRSSADVDGMAMVASSGQPFQCNKKYAYALWVLVNSDVLSIWGLCFSWKMWILFMNYLLVTESHLLDFPRQILSMAGIEVL